MLSSNFIWTFAPLVLSMVRFIHRNSIVYHETDRMSDRYKSMEDSENTFDFIIVGSGAAGSIVANRLSKNYKVLLLESGGEPYAPTNIPAFSLLFLNDPSMDWSHVTVPQTRACQALKEKRSGWSQGNVLGGTSVLNFLIYLRGHPLDYDRWANITNDPSWSYEGVLPHFKSIEKYKGQWDSNYVHGHNGEVTIQLPDYTGMGNVFVDAGVEKGLPHTDLNGRFTEGVSLIYNNMENGRRITSFRGFVEPIRSRKNLFIYKYSHVNKILMRANGRDAYGVEYIRHGVKKFAFAQREVIISAGINSPKLLLLSGIGPKEELEQLNIKSEVNLPAVGKNLQDHIAVYLGPFFTKDPISFLLDRDVNFESMTQIMDHGGQGPLSSSGTQAAAFLSSSFAKKAGLGHWPDLQYILLGTGVYDQMDTDFSTAFHVNETILSKYFAHAKGKDSFQIIVSLARPKQRGEIRLTSADPNTPPQIDPKYLHNDEDAQVLLEGIKRAVDLVETTKAFQKVGARFTTEVFPGCENIPFRSDAYWECYMRQYTITLHHIVGACSMGRIDSPDSVVDSQLRVVGTDNLRVIDASVAPIVPISNTQAASMMIGEKGSQMILNYWKNFKNPEEKNEIIR